MTLVKIISSLFIFVSTLAVSSVSAREIRMVTVNWEPILGSSLLNGGVVTEVVQAAFKEVGHNAKVEFMPWNRALHYVEIGERDLVLGAYNSKQRQEKFVVSDAYFTIDIGLVSLKEFGIDQYFSLYELKNYTIGVTDGWVNSEEFDAADFLKKDRAISPDLTTKKLFAKRTDIIAIAIPILKHELSQIDNVSFNQVKVLDPLLKKSTLHNLVSRKVPDHAEINGDFNKGLKIIKENGIYDAILQKHGFN